MTGSNGGAKKPRLKHEYCKPCWELKYCPFGPLVEYFPGPWTSDIPRSQVEATHARSLEVIRSADSDVDMLNAISMYLNSFPEDWDWLVQYDAAELSCNIFGHVCPVFFNAEAATETKEGRSTGRYVPREVMLKVVRRDGQICQLCHQPVPDDQVEFDHVIPHALGGPTTAANLRVACRTCNRKKRDTLTELLEDPWG